MLKKFAFFLPQFHQIPENDEWWGKGFTEWTNVKAAKPLYKGHIQPKHPLNNNYYNLLDKSTVIWQTKLLHEAGLDGFIYYHYYFDGKLLLERPVENLLKWKDIKQPFFFCWANHPWQRTWEGSAKILMPLNYGGRESWEKHFQYLLPFFKDNRYVKENNKPLFMVFKSSFKEKKPMFRYFNSRAIDEGFSGICFIESYHGDISIEKYNNEKSELTSYVYYREPAFSQFGNYKNKSEFYKARYHVSTKLRNRNLIHKPSILNGNELIKWKLQNEPIGENIAHGLWFEWDNTPRHKQRGYVITPYEKNLFNEYMNRINNEKYLFINAWNEWAEGMILEPTEENGYKYIEWLKEYKDKNNC